MINRKEQIRKIKIELDMLDKIASMQGKANFLATLDLGSITRNETAQELVECLKDTRILLDQLTKEKKDSFSS